MRQDNPFCLEIRCERNGSPVRWPRRALVIWFFWILITESNVRPLRERRIKGRSMFSGMTLMPWSIEARVSLFIIISIELDRTQSKLTVFSRVRTRDMVMILVILPSPTGAAQAGFISLSGAYGIANGCVSAQRQCARAYGVAISC